MKVGVDYDRLKRANAFLDFHIPSIRHRLAFDGRDRLQWVSDRGRMSSPARVPDPPEPKMVAYWQDLALTAVEIARGMVRRDHVRRYYPEWVDAAWPEDGPPASRLFGPRI